MIFGTIKLSDKLYVVLNISFRERKYILAKNSELFLLPIIDLFFKELIQLHFSPI